MIDAILNFISYWYMRYLLVSELYLVDIWELVMLHMFAVIFFTALWFFNKALLKLTARMLE